jgi:hypothetical protein
MKDGPITDGFVSGQNRKALDYMSGLTYKGVVTTEPKPLRWLHGQVKTPPMSPVARREIGFLLRALQEGERLTMPQSRPILRSYERSMVS